ncbi:MAG: hypothetical protein ACUVX1_17140 [Chloroflexota bacterium]
MPKKKPNDLSPEGHSLDRPSGRSEKVLMKGNEAIAEGAIRAGLFRPISLFPFPIAALRKLSERVKAVLVVEMSLGQLLEDVLLATRDRVPIEVYNRLGGAVPEPQGVVEAIKELAKR